MVHLNTDKHLLHQFNNLHYKVQQLLKQLLMQNSLQQKWPLEIFQNKVFKLNIFSVLYYQLFLANNVAVTRPQGGTLGELLNRGVKPVTKSVNIISGEFQSAYIAQARYQNLFGLA